MSNFKLSNNGKIYRARHKYKLNWDDKPYYHCGSVAGQFFKRRGDLLGNLKNMSKWSGGEPLSSWVIEEHKVTIEYVKETEADEKS